MGTQNPFFLSELAYLTTGSGGLGRDVCLQLPLPYVTICPQHPRVLFVLAGIPTSSRTTSRQPLNQGGLLTFAAQVSFSLPDIGLIRVSTFTDMFLGNNSLDKPLFPIGTFPYYMVVEDALSARVESVMYRAKKAQLVSPNTVNPGKRSSALCKLKLRTRMQWTTTLLRRLAPKRGTCSLRPGPDSPVLSSKLEGWSTTEIACKIRLVEFEWRYRRVPGRRRRRMSKIFEHLQRSHVTNFDFLELSVKLSRAYKETSRNLPRRGCTAFLFADNRTLI